MAKATPPSTSATATGRRALTSAGPDDADEPAARKPRTIVEADPAGWHVAATLRAMADDELRLAAAKRSELAGLDYGAVEEGAAPRRITEIAVHERDADTLAAIAARYDPRSSGVAQRAR